MYLQSWIETAAVLVLAIVGFHVEVWRNVNTERPMPTARYGYDALWWVTRLLVQVHGGNTWQWFYTRSYNDQLSLQQASLVRWKWWTVAALLGVATELEKVLVFVFSDSPSLTVSDVLNGQQLFVDQAGSRIFTPGYVAITLWMVSRACEQNTLVKMKLGG